MTELGPPDGAAPHVLVDDVEQPELDDETLHHLGRVRRLRGGAACTVTDGRGAWRPVRFTGRVDLDIDGDVRRLDRPTPPITIAFALTKGVKPDWTIQKLTEVGVDRIVPFRAHRSVVRWDDDKTVAQHRRMTAIARGAVEQAHRVWAPSIDPVADLDTVAAMGAVRAERGGEPPSLAATTIAIGPEGGWTEEERAQLRRSISFGDHVLRSETAAITAGMVLGTMRSGLVRSVGEVAE